MSAYTDSWFLFKHLPDTKSSNSLPIARKFFIVSPPPRAEEEPRAEDGARRANDSVNGCTTPGWMGSRGSRSRAGERSPLPSYRPRELKWSASRRLSQEAELDLKK